MAFPNNCDCNSIQVLVSRSVRPSSVSLGNVASQRVTPATSPNDSIETLTAGVSHHFPNQYTAIANLSASRCRMDRVSPGFTHIPTLSYSGTPPLFTQTSESPWRLSVIAAFVVEWRRGLNPLPALRRSLLLPPINHPLLFFLPLESECGAAVKDSTSDTKRRPRDLCVFLSLFIIAAE